MSSASQVSAAMGLAGAQKRRQRASAASSRQQANAITCRSIALGSRGRAHSRKQQGRQNAAGEWPPHPGIEMAEHGCCSQSENWEQARMALGDEFPDLAFRADT